MASSQGFHEEAGDLRVETRDRHRAIASLQEELEAVDWYDQRVDACTDAELAGLLAHNRDEEKEHAAMLLEWLRRRDTTWSGKLEQYLFTDAPILAIEAAAEAESDAGGGDAAPTAPRASGDLGIRSLRGEEW